jgi:hypothetical protein
MGSYYDIYPYHFHGGEGGNQDPKVFASLVGDSSEVKLCYWYGDDQSYVPRPRVELILSLRRSRRGPFRYDA